MATEIAEGILRLIAGHWPSPEMSEDECAIWLTKLYGCDPEIAGKVLDRMVETTHFRPTPGEFQVAYRKEARKAAQPKTPCNECDGGWIWVGDADAHPCGRCRPELHNAWRIGAMQPQFAPLGEQPDTLARIAMGRFFEERRSRADAAERTTAMRTGLIAPNSQDTDHGGGHVPTDTESAPSVSPAVTPERILAGAITRIQLRQRRYGPTDDAAPLKSEAQ